MQTLEEISCLGLSAGQGHGLRKVVDGNLRPAEHGVGNLGKFGHASIAVSLALQQTDHHVGAHCTGRGDSPLGGCWLSCQSARIAWLRASTAGRLPRSLPFMVRPAKNRSATRRVQRCDHPLRYTSQLRAGLQPPKRPVCLERSRPARLLPRMSRGFYFLPVVSPARTRSASR